MSMLNFCISVYDFHDCIDPTKRLGLHCNGTYVGSIAYADDFILLSNTKKSLDTMINNSLAYATK